MTNPIEEAETIIELVETVPIGYVLLAALIGGAIVFVAMMAVSKAPAQEA